MKHGRPVQLSRCCAAILVAAGMVGCAALTTTNDAIIRVQARQDPAKAGRLTLQGVKAMQGGNIDRAVARFTSAVNADPNYGPAHNNLGLLHYEQGNLYQAVLAFETAMDLMPSDPIVYYNLGLTLESAGRTDEALDLYWQAVEMEPSNPNFLGNLVRLRVRLGDEGPDMITQLQDLILIETRPSWRQWADEKLSIAMNPALDRGPETPDFNSNRDRDSTSDDDPKDNIIDLTPESNRLPSSSSQSKGPSERSLGEMILSEPDFRDSNPKPQVRSKPIPIQDAGSLQTLPPSIQTPVQVDLDSELFQ
ncbi:MAG: tetratricopeptide repeat protein [Rubripirellula sp.]